MIKKSLFEQGESDIEDFLDMIGEAAEEERKDELLQSEKIQIVDPFDE